MQVMQPTRVPYPNSRQSPFAICHENQERVKYEGAHNDRAELFDVLLCLVSGELIWRQAVGLN